MAVRLGFRNVHFSPRGGGLGWAMPLGVGIGLATGKHTVCFVGDGGTHFSIHALWTAAKYAIPSIFICFVNCEYRLLKDLCVCSTVAHRHKTVLGTLDPCRTCSRASRLAIDDHESWPTVCQRAVQDISDLRKLVDLPPAHAEARRDANCAVSIEVPIAQFGHAGQNQSPRMAGGTGLAALTAPPPGSI